LGSEDGGKEVTTILKLLWLGGGNGFKEGRPGKKKMRRTSSSAEMIGDVR